MTSSGVTGSLIEPEEVAYIKDITQSEFLFNGRDLNGWRKPTGEWMVADTVSLAPISRRHSP